MGAPKLAGAVLPLLLIGCASAPPAPRHVDLSGQCATSLEALVPALLVPAVAPEGKKLKAPPLTDFASLGQCVETASGRVPTTIWKLHEAPLPSMARLEIIANNAATLAAAVTLLDEDYQAVRRHGFDEFSRRGYSYTLDVFLNPKDSNVRYLLLTPDDAWVGKQDETIVGITNTVYLGGGATFNVGSEGKSVRQLTSTGQLRIQLLPQ